MGTSTPSGTNRLSLAVDFLMPGTMMGVAVTDQDGNVLLASKTPFTEEFIAGLKRNRIERIYYAQGDDGHKQAAVAAEEQNPLLANPKLRELSSRIAADMTREIANGEFIQTTGVHGLVDILLKLIGGFRSFPASLLNPHEECGDFGGHALHVAVLAMVIAANHGFENSLIKQIGIGAWMHDIGKLRLPPELVHRRVMPDAAAIEELKKHAALGFELIKLNGQLSGIVRKIVLLHHEGTDGSGYPLHLQEKDVGYYPYLVGLADILDNLTTNRPWQKALGLRDLLGVVLQASGKRLPVYLVQNFIKNVSKSQSSIVRYNVGDFVLLNTQEIAQVVAIPPENNARPDIRIIKSSKGTNVDPPLHVHLARDTQRRIEELLKPEVQRQLGARYPLPGRR